MVFLKKMVTAVRWFCFPRYRRYMIFRGYRRLHKQGQSNLVQQCKHELSRVATGVMFDKASPEIFFAARPEADLVIRQFLSKRTGEKSICHSVYNAVGGGVPIHHLPPHTYPALRNLGIPIWSFGSSIRWSVSLLIYWLYGCWMVLKLGRSTAAKNSEITAGSKAFFQSLPVNAVPDRKTSFERQDIVSWYSRWDKRNPSIKSVSHQHKNRINVIVNGITLEYRPAGWSGYMSVGTQIKFLLWSLRVAFMALTDLLRGRWWHALLFSEAVMAKRLTLSAEGTLPAEIWFHHEYYRFRPIWTYEAEARGVKSYLYFYSVNNQTVQPSSHDFIITGYWHLMNWPRYIVWDKQQKEFLEKYNQPGTELIQVDPTPYTDSNDDLKSPSLPSIAVFDIPSYVSEITFALGQPYNYQKNHVAKAFYDDIVKVARAHGFAVCTKPKLRNQSHLAPGYRATLDRLDKQPDVYRIEAGISPHRLIMATQMTISTPYSTPSVIAKALGKPTCFYDPTGLLPKNSNFSHGIKVINTPEDLSDWIKNNRMA